MSVTTPTLANRRSANAVHGSRRQRVVRGILAALFAGEFRPGQRMRVEHLAEQFEVSATPVREALVELAGIGVLDLHPNRGAVLRAFGPQQLLELVQVRRILECEAARCACGRIAPIELRVLERELLELIGAPRDAEWSDRTRQLDSQLHEMIAQHCGSERLAHEINRYAVLHRALRDARHERRTARANYSQMDENAEHLAIVRALIAEDAHGAGAAMATHIDQSAVVLRQDLFGPDSPQAAQTNLPAGSLP
jgi:DNA-binding GntR family transcriptional regulator